MRKKIFSSDSKEKKKQEAIHTVFEIEGVNGILYDYLNFDDQVILSFLSENAQLNYLAQKNKQTQVFLEMVVEGNEDEAKKCIDARLPILFSKSTVSDRPQRTFANLSGFQYALWEMDFSMLRMFLTSINQLPEDEKSKALAMAKQQLMEVEKIGLTYTFKEISHVENQDKKMSEKITTITVKGSHHYNFNDIENALTKFIQIWPMERITNLVQSKLLNKKFSIFNGKKLKQSPAEEWKELETMWCKTVGLQQFLMPAYLLQIYCDPKRSLKELCDEFFRTVDFKREKFPRILTVLYKEEKVHLLQSKDMLGCRFALSRGSAKSVNTSLDLLFDPLVDLLAIKLMHCKVVEEYNQIIRELKVPGIKPLRVPNFPDKNFQVPILLSDEEIRRALVIELLG